MVTLRDMIDVYWKPTQINVTARDTDLKFLHEWMFGLDINETMYMYHDRKEGKLDIVDVRVNHFGTTKRNGDFEMGWGIIEKNFPDLILDAPIQHFMPGHQRGPWDGDILYIDVEMSKETVEMLKALMKVRPLEEGDQ